MKYQQEIKKIMIMKKWILKYVCTHWVYGIEDVEQVIEWIGFKGHFDLLKEQRSQLWDENVELKKQLTKLTVPTITPEVTTVQEVTKKKRHYKKKTNN